MTTSREDELEALRRTLLAEGIRETADPDTSLGRGDLLPEAPRTSQLPRALLTLGGEGDYRLEYVLGEGGMATVWLAQQRALLREVAVNAVLDRVCYLPRRIQQRVVGVTLLGELHHMFPDFQGGMGFGGEGGRARAGGTLCAFVCVCVCV